MVNSTARSIIVSAATVLIADLGLSLLIGVAAVGSASAEPTTECSVMAHPPAGQVDPGSGSPLTRPGQLGDLNQPPPPNTDMPMDCIPIGHS